jgi:hypothetical protein
MDDDFKTRVQMIRGLTSTLDEDDFQIILALAALSHARTLIVDRPYAAITRGVLHASDSRIESVNGPAVARDFFDHSPVADQSVMVELIRKIAEVEECELVLPRSSITDLKISF